jgi:hypothetical protein
MQRSFLRVSDLPRCSRLVRIWSPLTHPKDDWTPARYQPIPKAMQVFRHQAKRRGWYCRVSLTRTSGRA